MLVVAITIPVADRAVMVVVRLLAHLAPVGPPASAEPAELVARSRLRRVILSLRPLPSMSAGLMPAVAMGFRPSVAAPVADLTPCRQLLLEVLRPVALPELVQLLAQAAMAARLLLRLQLVQ